MWVQKVEFSHVWKSLRVIVMGCVTFSWSRSSCKMTCLSRHSSKKSSECRLSRKAGKKVSWVQSTTSSLSLSPSFSVSSSETAKRGHVFWAWATLHHEGSVQPRSEELQSLRAAMKGVDPRVSLAVSESGHTPVTSLWGEHACTLMYSRKCI